MKKILSNIYTLAALVMVGAATFTACSSDDATNEQQPVNPTGKYTMTIKATKGDGALTRGLTLSGNTIGVKWNDGEVVEVYQNQSNTDVHLGTLYAAASNDGSTTLTGNLTVAPVKGTGAAIYFYLNNSYNKSYSNQNGVLLAADNATKSIEKDYDFAQAYVNSGEFDVEGNKVIVPNGITLVSQQAIVKFTLVGTDGSTPIIATSMTVKDIAQNLSGGTSFISGSPLVVTSPNETNVFYVAINGLYTADKHSDIILTATTASGDTYIYTKLYDASHPVYFEHGKYYAITAKMKKTTTTFNVGDVINVSERIDLTEEWNVNGSWYIRNPGSYTYTLIRANITGTPGSKGEVTEAEDGAFYVVKYDEGNYSMYIFDDQSMPVTSTSDGLVVTSVGQSGSYKTCTLTVHEIAPAYYSATTADIGKVIDDDGNMYDNVTAAENAGATPRAMIAYIGSESDCTHGLALALANVGGRNSVAGHTSTIAGYTSVAGGTWRLPSILDWQSMFVGCGATGTPSSTSMAVTNTTYLKAKLSNAGATALSSGWDKHYWTSTVYSPNYNWYLLLGGDDATFGQLPDSDGDLARAVLAF